MNSEDKGMVLFALVIGGCVAITVIVLGIFNTHSSRDCIDACGQGRVVECGREIKCSDSK